MTRGIQVARANRSELDLVTDLLQAQFDEHDISTSGPELRAAVEAVLEDERFGFFLIARQADAAVGVAAISFAWTLEHGGKSAWLDELYVVPDRRGQGAGTALLRASLDEVRAQGCAAMDLEVEHDHKRAERLYQREGFLPLSRSRWVLALT
jgi:GNAT superfamily N-acetyltransferase